MPHHHKREIGSLGNETKGETCEMMEKCNVEHIDLPCNTMERIDLNNDKDGLQHRGEFLRVPFDPTEQKERSGKNKPKVALTEELKIAFVTCLQQNQPEKLECQVENFLFLRGHKILWTPPRCCDLQLLNGAGPVEKMMSVGTIAMGIKYTTSLTYLGKDCVV